MDAVVVRCAELVGMALRGVLERAGSPRSSAS